MHKVNYNDRLSPQLSVAQMAAKVKVIMRSFACAGPTASLSNLFDQLLGGAELGPYATKGVALQPRGSAHRPKTRFCQLEDMVAFLRGELGGSQDEGTDQ
jgi:hypothetical protein